MEHLEYPNRGDFLDCENCNVKIIFTESSLKERRKRLVDFLEAHLATCYQRRYETK